MVVFNLQWAKAVDDNQAKIFDAKKKKELEKSQLDWETNKQKWLSLLQEATLKLQEPITHIEGTSPQPAGNPRHQPLLHLIVLQGLSPPCLPCYLFFFYVSDE